MTRIEAARRRATGAKQIAAAVAAAGFLGVLLLARGSHPGHALNASASNSGSTPSTSSSSESNDDDFGFGSSSVAPSGGSSTPQAQTSVS